MYLYSINSNNVSPYSHLSYLKNNLWIQTVNQILNAGNKMNTPTCKLTDIFKVKKYNI